MLKYIKKQISELLQTLIEAEQDVMTVIQEADHAGLINILADVQDAAVAIGSQIEEAEGVQRETESAGKAGAAETKSDAENADKIIPAREMVLMLERYCEVLWRITQEQGTEGQQSLAEEAWMLLGDVEGLLERIPEQMAAVFMPYKASMWDCMESVWMAACEDPDCVPYVVPIPYFDLKDGEVAARHYEGDKFPEYVPVIHYSDFPLEELHPEAVFLHNPFDDYNTVTSVLPQYYSGELKKMADRLVYIPYFVTGDAVFRTHRYLPSYENMDFIVTQCEKTIDSFSADLPREKFLPFGSPVADRVLRLEREKPEIPREWRPQLKNGKDFGGDIAVMLNASISILMGQRERFFDKLEYIMEEIKQREGITLVWRPHPLLAATAKSMGAEYAERLAALEDKFSKEKIGVLDKTPDVGITVALCDAYLGETASSVIHMFGIARKPRFYINLQIQKEVYEDHDGAAEGSGANIKESGSENTDLGNTEPDWNRVEGNKMFVSAHCQAGDSEYFVLDNVGWIVEKEAGRDDEYIPIVRIPGREIVRGRAYRGMEVKEDCIWVYPENAEGIFIYDIKSGGMRKIFRGDEKKDFGREDQGGAADWSSIEPDEKCISVIRAEKYKRGNPGHVWYESEDSRLEDYFRFLRTTEAKELKGTLGAYLLWIANLDGSCGKKVLQAVKESCFRGMHHD